MEFDLAVTTVSEVLIYQLYEVIPGNKEYGSHGFRHSLIEYASTILDASKFRALLKVCYDSYITNHNGTQSMKDMTLGIIMPYLPRRKLTELGTEGILSLISKIISDSIIHFSQNIQNIRGDMYYMSQDEEARSKLLSTMKTTMSSTIENTCHSLISNSHVVPLSRYDNLEKNHKQVKQELATVKEKYEKIYKKYKASKKKVEELSRQIADIEFDNASETSSIRYLTRN